MLTCAAHSRWCTPSTGILQVNLATQNSRDVRVVGGGRIRPAAAATAAAAGLKSTATMVAPSAAPSAPRQATALAPGQDTYDIMGRLALKKLCRDRGIAVGHDGSVDAACFDVNQLRQTLRAADNPQPSSPSALPAPSAPPAPPAPGVKAPPPHLGRPVFSAAASFQGSRPGYVFKMGPNGVGYYIDENSAPPAPPAASVSGAGGAAAAAGPALAAPTYSNYIPGGIPANWKQIDRTQF